MIIDILGWIVSHRPLLSDRSILVPTGWSLLKWGRLVEVRGGCIAVSVRSASFLTRTSRKIGKKTGKNERWLEMTGNVPYYGNNFYFDAVFTRTVVGEDTRLKSSTIWWSATTGLGLDAGRRERPAPNLYDKTRTCLQHAVTDRRDLCCSTAGGRWGNAVKPWELKESGQSDWHTHTQYTWFEIFLV